jgi:hypothetical protein
MLQIDPIAFLLMFFQHKGLNILKITFCIRLEMFLTSRHRLLEGEVGR